MYRRGQSGTTVFRIPQRWNLHAGYTFRPDNRSWSLQANGWVMSQGSVLFAQAGLMGKLGKILLGGSYNSNQEIGISAGLKTEPMKLMYTYGLVLGALEGVAGGNHEVSMIWYFELPKVQSNSTAPESGSSASFP